MAVISGLPLVVAAAFLDSRVVEHGKLQRYEHDLMPSAATIGSSHRNRFPGHAAEKMIDADEGPKPRLGLLDMPNEMLLEIMAHLPLSGLYCLRQTSFLFMQLFSRPEFNHLHEQVPDGIPPDRDLTRPDVGWAKFRISCLSAKDRYHLSVQVQRHLYCAPCLEKHDSGMLDRALERYSEPVECAGCNMNHALALFRQEDIRLKRLDGRRLSCMGRYGTVTPCKHGQAKVVKWPEIEGRYNTRGINPDSEIRPALCHSICGNLWHRPGGYDPRLGRDVVDTVSEFPRLVIGRHSWRLPPMRAMIGFGWDFPLLDVDTADPPSLHEIRTALVKQLTERRAALNIQKRCRHITFDQLRDLARRGFCGGIEPNGPLPYDPQTRRRSACCSCHVEPWKACRVCGAMYFWSWTGGRVYLSYRYYWNAYGAASPGWVFLLDEVHQRKHLDAQGKHVLWCDSPSCHTNRMHRWEAIVKADCINEERALMSRDDNRILDEIPFPATDYREMKRMSLGTHKFLEFW
ncbi:hypothetical protein GMORB2_2280 [Geosmithia morbida]|uniref:F-box domain-containing protein n=1 Tax=Geosmithia morbida TaxID=1094350 RepID=A0A9P4YTA4_9HYPO|nr:uncharacterized protein GMORB2_2280 [Geosmithia morbida]KAF4121318.1 hypothetical protein GMORB2_2280 [Geosmithia morbida]